MLTTWIKAAIEGVVAPVLALFTKKEDVKLEKYRVDGTVNIEALRVEVEARKIDAEWRSLVTSEKWVKRGRAVLIMYTLAYVGLVFWDSCVRNLAPDLTWRILELPAHLQYIPHVTIVLLVGEAAYNRFKR